MQPGVHHLVDICKIDMTQLFAGLFRRRCYQAYNKFVDAVMVLCVSWPVLLCGLNHDMLQMPPFR